MEEPCIETLLAPLASQMVLFAFCKPEYVMRMIDDSRSRSKPTLFMNRECYLADEELSIGHITHVFIEIQKKKKPTAGWILHHSSRLYDVKVSQ